MINECMSILCDESQTILLGSNLARICINEESCLIYLDGCIGTGKSTLCTGFLRSLGYVHCIKSPTYTLVESYFLFNKNIHHIDFYRLHSRLDLLSIGIQDYLNNQSILLIEWSIRGRNYLPAPDILISINFDVCEKFRKIILESYSDLGQKIVSILLETG